MHLTLHLTTACNMRCSYCYAPPRDGAPMSEDVARAAVDLGARLSTGSCGIVFFGGEPLLCKERIADTVAYARRRERDGDQRYHFKITTNGLALDDDWLDYAIRNDILVAMSFDGVRAAHDAHRRLPNGRSSYDVLLARLKALLAVRPYASVLTTVNPDTAQYLAESIELLIDLDVRYPIVSPNYAGDWTEADFRVLQKQYQRLGRRYIEWTRAGRKFYLSPFEVKLSSHINRHCWQKERCELAQRQISVDPQGYLFPCVQFPRAGKDSRWCIGHVSTGIDETARQALHDESEAEKETCRGCALADRCHNTCGCLNWQTTGTVNGISPVLCRHEQMLIPIADRVGEKLYKKRDPLFLHKHYNSAYPVLSLLEDVLVKK
ncbi:MAG: radical SAM protein [Phycisphaerae bacterium]|jgi:uncharacterized protein